MPLIFTLTMHLPCFEHAQTTCLYMHIPHGVYLYIVDSWLAVSVASLCINLLSYSTLLKLLRQYQLQLAFF